MLKNLFDFVGALFLVLIFGLPIILCVILASIETRSFGLFKQTRIGQYGKPFTIFKIRTLGRQNRVLSPMGNFFKMYKFDEFSQFLNILNGAMSFVGPRPDLSGYADKLKGDDRLVLQVRPAITDVASLKYRNEEELLNKQLNPKQYNDSVIWPEKVRINKWYVQNQSFLLDLKIFVHTIVPSTFDAELFMSANSLKK